MFPDRTAAGRELARALTHLSRADPVVLGLPRGGVPVAAEVAAALSAPLDVLLVRKVGLPRQPELAMGAIGESDVRIVNDVVVGQSAVTTEVFAAVEARERIELQRRAEHIRAVHPRVPIDGRTVVIVDDGLATGSTARAACQIARARGATHIVLAVPVAPSTWVEDLDTAADEYVAIQTPTGFRAVGQFYAQFPPVTDDEVVDALHQNMARMSPDPKRPSARSEPDGHPVTT